jgi:DNA-binding transcriptional LysR family regulator
MLFPMRLIAALVEHKSLNKAASVLNVTQPALSRQLQNIEEKWQVALFLRKGKRLELTRAGQLAYEYAGRFLDLEKQFQGTLESFRSTDFEHKVTIGASLTTLQSTLPDLISIYMKSHPKADFQVLTGKTHEVVEWVGQRRVDIGLIAAVTSQPSLTCIPLFQDHLSLISPKHRLLDTLHPKELGIQLLNQLPMVLFSKGTWYRTMIDHLLNRHGIYPDVKMEIDSFEAMARMVSTGVVYSLLPHSYIREDSSFRGYEVIDLPELTETTRTTSIIYPSDEELRFAAKLFIQNATEVYG